MWCDCGTCEGGMSEDEMCEGERCEGGDGRRRCQLTQTTHQREGEEFV